MKCETQTCPSTHVRIHRENTDEAFKLVALCDDCALTYADQFLRGTRAEWLVVMLDQMDEQRRYALWERYQQARAAFTQPYHSELSCASSKCRAPRHHVAEYCFSSGAVLPLCRACALASQRVMRDQGILISREYYEQVYDPLAFKPFEP